MLRRLVLGLVAFHGLASVLAGNDSHRHRFCVDRQNEPVHVGAVSGAASALDGILRVVGAELLKI